MEKNNGRTSRKGLEVELGNQLNALISAVHALNVRAATKFDSSIQPAAFHIVRWLYSYGPTNAAKLADSTAMDRSSVSRLIKQLQLLGYVTREVSPNDGRGVMLSLTEKGKQQVIEALNEKESVYYERLSNWGDVELQEFISMLKHFNGFNGL
ncbi:MarR family transcriptional regulator [Paenibacillus sp. CGMCC 1.16610]|uniref:MarR family transcriptional regulator n=1 Tax=Paenibacillus anseongense TaxID=2682845 RepID=A0ABW9UEL0_9BACL|nr:MULTISPECIES: MarR family transcriptional regulator [Paenibacillus]MBA2937226.1 MarR family transcriptional regulator [Paenibacillus sp. CGMCC 1.16610]MVQ36285.1 MarR family transcriptional regulator [Paenibacillus anseongense]